MNHVLIISDYHSLLAVHKAIIEAKFSGSTVNLELLGSPILAKTAQEIVELLAIKEGELGIQNSYDKWKQWQELDETRQEWNVAVNYIVSHIKTWANWTEQQKREFVHVVISPYTLNPQLLNYTIDKINSAIT